jgi:glycosyltransferase involved in cell wall biosynthesis
MDVGGVPEIVLDGKTGYLVPQGDREALVDRAALLLSHPELRADLGRRGKERARTHFSLEAMIDKTAQLDGRLLEAKGICAL